MKFESTYEDWVEGRLTQSEVAAILGQCERTFRRNIDRFNAPLGQTWDSFFLGGPTISDDFLPERATQHQPEREAL